MNKDGGPAFPDKRPQGPLAQTIYPGISKRDYFAAAALTGINANSARFRSVEEFAQYAYRAADAMLKESDHD
jgi:hypothetical protein